MKMWRVESFNEKSYYEGDLLMVRSGGETETQRENIFHSRCLILGKLCSIIIDDGSSVNVASLRLVEKLSILTFPHPKSCNEREELVVDKQMTLAFTLGNYKDEVMCDVVPMEAIHILLGKPWQYDKRVTHDGDTSRFSFEHMGHKIVLKPLSPKEVYEDQIKVKAKREEEKKERVKVEKAKEKETKKKREKNKSVRENKELKGEKSERGKKKIKIGKSKTKSEKEESLLVSRKEVRRVILEFKDVFPKYVPYGLPLFEAIKHPIDLTLGATLPSKASYIANLEESKEIQSQVRESISPYAILVILVPKKDDTWRMYMNYKHINNILLDINTTLLHLDDLLDA
ncbi:hypothetical protein CR513_16568, partial [Mucuna pruriens]